MDETIEALLAALEPIADHAARRLDLLLDVTSHSRCSLGANARLGAGVHHIEAKRDCAPAWGGQRDRFDRRRGKHRTTGFQHRHWRREDRRAQGRRRRIHLQHRGLAFLRQLGRYRRSRFLEC